LYTADVDAAPFQVGEHELQLVDVPHLEHEVLRPDILLIVRQKITETEMLRHIRVGVVRRDLDEAARIGVSVSRRP
jgi:hypothetical protein